MHRVAKITQQLSSTSKPEINSNRTNACCQQQPSLKQPVKVLVTGAAGNIAYSILFGIGRGKLLGDDQPIELRLLDIPYMANKMNGVLMELEDCAFPLLTKIIATTDYKTAFEDAQIALLIGAKPRSKGMVRADLLKANANIFKGQGEAIEKWSNRNIKVVVVGNPANTNCLITMKYAPSINPRNFTAMTRLDQNRAKAQLANKIDTQISNIHNVIIWGNHSKTQFPDISHAYVTCPGISQATTKPMITSVRSYVNDDQWLDEQFISCVQQRGSAVIKARGLSSAASAGNACLDHVRDWMNGTPDGEIVSMSVISDGECYGIPKDIIYSFPCTCSNGNWNIVKHLPISEKARALMQNTAKELIQERQTALSLF